MANKTVKAIVKPLSKRELARNIGVKKPKRNTEIDNAVDTYGIAPKPKKKNGNQRRIDK